MKEILFKGKRADNEEWVEGFYFEEAGSFIKQKSSRVSTETYLVIPETVSQFIGLRDSKHTEEYPEGQPIFEGDIVVCTQKINGSFIDEHIEVGYVKMKHGAFGLHRKQGYYRPFKDWLEDYEYEVVGNIYDNPGLLNELLKGYEED